MKQAGNRDVQSTDSCNRACKFRGQLGARRSYSPCYRIGLCFVFGCNNRTVPNLCFPLSEGLLQAEAVEHFAGDNDHGNHEF